MKRSIILIVVVIVGGAVFLGIRNGIQPGVRVVLEVDNTDVAYGETVVVSSKVINNTLGIVTGGFSITCTEPYLSLNGEIVQTVKVCGQAITEVKIYPFQMRTHKEQYGVTKSIQDFDLTNDTRFPFIVDQPGVYALKVVWEGWESEAMEFEVQE